ncbi:short transient receptor potential channel 4-associated protein [Lethenteron reissneri]|uniref:short transient receptor potential channel 4-associated protein n=1 Tax=Lethenteron reissneri TaxID=7753 RepID=UPI002AB73349|nr:short transient receptor potential channel 4-associated protein [Lethenteron reissneri]
MAEEARSAARAGSPRPGCSSHVEKTRRGSSSSSSVVHSLARQRLGQQRLASVVQMPEPVLKLRDKRAKWNNIPQSIRRLYDNSQPHNINYTECISTLQDLISLMTVEGMESSADYGQVPQPAKFINADVFDLFGGVELLVDVLMRPTLLPQDQSKLRIQMHLTKAVLEVLHNVCMCTERVAKRLSERLEFVMYLFTLMSEKRGYLQAASLMEDVLGTKKEMILLEEIPDLVKLVARFDRHQFANFCRVLSVMVSELEPVGDENQTLLAQNEQLRRHCNPTSAEVNQAMLLNIPGIVKRLCELATQKSTERQSPFVFLQELEHWLNLMDNSVALDMTTSIVDESGLDTSMDMEYSDHPIIDQLPLTMHEVYKVEVLYLLCVLLTGKHRDEVHKLLAEFRLIPGLNDLFEKLIWKNRSHNHRLHSPNQNCDCSPDVALKIQFLRLLHSFSDHHENKYLLLNRLELMELGAIALEAKVSETKAVVNTNRRLVCLGDKGLLSKLIEVMKEEPPESSFRFWLARAVESFLRGTTSYVDQIFLLRRGLLEHILSCIIDSESTSRDILQSNFDLLGELMKFNVKAFKMFDTCVDTEEKFQKFLVQINSSLVDSNMFIRCIVLSLERFSQTDDSTVAEVMLQCRLLTYMASVENQLTILMRLISIVQVETLTQENVSCLNTSLVFLMLALRRGGLPIYLNALREKELADNKPGHVLTNFHSLLQFWQTHYLNKDKDSTSLENSSCINFSYWKETVSTLLDEDRSSPYALLSYVRPSCLGTDSENTCSEN